MAVAFHSSPSPSASCVPCAETPTVATTDLKTEGHRRHQVRRGYLLFFRRHRLPCTPSHPTPVYTSSHYYTLYFSQVVVARSFYQLRSTWLPSSPPPPPPTYRSASCFFFRGGFSSTDFVLTATVEIPFFNCQVQFRNFFSILFSFIE